MIFSFLPSERISAPRMSNNTPSPHPLLLRTIALEIVTDAVGNSFLVDTVAPREGSKATRIKSG